MHEHEAELIEIWVDRLHVLSQAYNQRPVAELFETVSQAFRANAEVLTTGRYDRIEYFIDYITRKRLESGFPLSDVQRAFELFRSVLIEQLQTKGLKHLLAGAVGPINECLSYTIHRFSDHFQHMHEQAIVEHAQNLERQIAIRTAELSQSEQRYKTLVEEINDGYFVIKNERIVFANQCFCRMHGAKLEDVLGKHFTNFVVSKCRNKVLKAFRAAFRSDSSVGRLEYLRTGCRPEEAPTEITSRVLDLGQGPVMIGICRDTSARVAMETKLREHERMAYVGHLTASLSHELRNPLTSVKMNLQLLSRKLDLNGFDRRRLEITVQEVSRLEGILRQLLDMARPSSVSFSTVDLSKLVGGCVEVLEPEARCKDLRIYQKHPKRLATAQLDTGKFEQAIINLLLNAIEASPVGGAITIWTKAKRGANKGMLEIGIRDNGSGITPEQRPHLFTPFFTTKTQGTGLGLCNVKRIVRAHDGTLEVRSQVGRGAAFIVRVPCRPENVFLS